MTRSLLIIFVKNPILGKVKTRLAKTVGDQYALHVYLHLLNYTASIAAKSSSDIAIYYSDFVDNNDLWSNNRYQKYIQKGNSLGERMNNAFIEAFQKNYEKALIIGSDCAQLTTEIINNAFKKLNEVDVVIGPAYDGGYYLLGMKKYYIDFFLNKEWSTSEVYSQTVDDVKRLNLSYATLPVLLDIDTEEDLLVLPQDKI